MNRINGINEYYKIKLNIFINESRPYEYSCGHRYHDYYDYIDHKHCFKN